MTRFFAVAVLALALTLTATADEPMRGAWKRINMEHRFQTAKARYPDLRKLTICNLKVSASKAFKLNPYKFDIHLNGKRLAENKSLASLGLRDGITVQVVDVKSTPQCAKQYPGFKS